jgi:symplekin
VIDSNEKLTHVSLDRITRSYAILTAKRWLVPDHPVIAPIIEEFALSTLFKTAGPPVPSETSVKESGETLTKRATSSTTASVHDEDTLNKHGDDENNWNQDDIIRHLELFFALCSKKHEFLSE